MTIRKPNDRLGQIEYNETRAIDMIALAVSNLLSVVHSTGCLAAPAQTQYFLTDPIGNHHIVAVGREPTP